MADATPDEVASDRQAARVRAFRLQVATVAALFLAFATLGGAFLWYDNANQWVAHTHQVRNGVADTLQSLTATESAQRGYILTGDPEFLIRAAFSRAESERRVDAIEALTRDNPGQQARIAELRRLMAVRLAVVGETLRRQQAGDTEGAIAVIREGAGVRAMDGIRDLMVQINAAELRLEAERTARANTVRMGGGVALLVFAVLLGLFFIKAQKDLDREREEEADTAERLRGLLVERTLLLEEVNHRVKNSLQQIASVVRLQSRAVAHPEAREALENTLSRIMAVGRVHEQLYRGGPLADFDAGAYTETLARELVDSLGRDDVTLETVVESVRVDMRQAAPIAIILNELVTNALKYGCPPDRPCTIRVGFATDGDDHRLSVFDDGPGLPEGFSPRTTRSLGMRAIQALAGQLGGRLDVESPETGAGFAVVFPRSTV